MTIIGKSTFVASFALIAVLIFQNSGVAQGPADMKARARIRAEQHFMQHRLEEMKKATGELATLTKALVKEVAIADGYTTSAKLVESSDKIEKLAKRIEGLAKTVKKRARGR